MDADVLNTEHHFYIIGEPLVLTAAYVSYAQRHLTGPWTLLKPAACLGTQSYIPAAINTPLLT